MDSLTQIITYVKGHWNNPTLFESFLNRNVSKKWQKTVLIITISSPYNEAEVRHHAGSSRLYGHCVYSE